jgi:CHAD domain-containing protein
MTPRIRPFRVSSLISTRTRVLNRTLPEAIEGSERALHQARVSSRRLREAVPVIATGLKKAKAKKTSRTIRKLTRALGSVRELDVALSLIEEFAAKDDISRPALQDVRLHVAAEREQRREAMLTRLAAVDLSKLDRRLAGLVEASMADTTEQWREALGSRLLKRGKRLAQSVSEAGQLYAPEQLHRVRIDAKKLRYALELASDSGVPTARPLVAAVKQAQAILGTLHDLQVLQSHVAAVQMSAPGTVNAPHEALAAIAGRIEEQCRVLHGRYIKRSPKLLEVVALVRTDVVPKLAAARPLKMSLARAERAARATS